MRIVFMVLSVLLVLTGCMAGVDTAPDSALEMRAAVGRSAHVLRETHIVDRNSASVVATLAARSQQCLTAPQMARNGAEHVELVAHVAEAPIPMLVVDVRETPAGGTELEIIRDTRAGDGEAAAILAWAGGITHPCPTKR